MIKKQVKGSYLFTCLFITHLFIYLFIYLFGVLRRFQHCTGHIRIGSFVGRGNQYIQLVKVLYCKLPTIGKQLPTFPHEVQRIFSSIIWYGEWGLQLTNFKVGVLHPDQQPESFWERFSAFATCRSRNHTEVTSRSQGLT